MDFHALSRRELQALCKRNSIRANMSNAAMANALRSLPSVDGTDQIGRTAPPPMSAIKSAEEVIIEEKTEGSLLPDGGRTRSKSRTVTADNMELDVPDQAALQGSQRTGAPQAVAPVEAEELVGEEQGHGCPLPRGGRARVKTRRAALRECQRTGAPEAVAPVEAEEVVGEEQGHGCPLPRGGRARVKTRSAVAHTKDEVVLAPDTLQVSQRTAAAEASAPVETEEVATGKRRTRRSAKSKVKMALDQKEEVPAAVWKEQEVSDKSCDDRKEHEVLTVVAEAVMKGQNVTKRPESHETEEEVPDPAILRRSQRTAAPVEAEEVTMAKKRTRRSTRSKVAAAAQKGQKADSSDVAIGSNKRCDCPKEAEVAAVVEEEATKPPEGGNVTRRAVTHKTEEVPAPASFQWSQKTAVPEATVPVEAEEVATTKRRRRRGRFPRSKVAAAAQNGKKSDSSDAASIGSPVLASDQSCDDPKEEQLVAVVEEQDTKPKEAIVEEQEQTSTVQGPATISILSKVESADIPDKTAAANYKTIKEDGFTITGEVDQRSLLVNTLDRFAKPMPMHEFTVKGEKKEGECWWMLM